MISEEYLRSDDISLLHPPYERRPTGPETRVRFYNMTESPVDVVWLRNEQTPVIYATLDYRKFVDIRTYEGHPWIFRRSRDGALMRVNHEEIFWPVSPARNIIVRNSYIITNPVLSLVDTCCRRFMQRDYKFSTSMIPTLPYNLQRKVADLFRTSNTYTRFKRSLIRGPSH